MRRLAAVLTIAALVIIRAPVHADDILLYNRGNGNVGFAFIRQHTFLLAIGGDMSGQQAGGLAVRTVYPAYFSTNWTNFVVTFDPQVP